MTVSRSYIILREQSGLIPFKNTQSNEIAAFYVKNQDSYLSIITQPKMHPNCIIFLKIKIRFDTT